MPNAERDGRTIFYERQGTGPELVFVPGWCCDQTFFAPQFEHFARTHTVTALDMRWAEADIPELADEIAWFCGEVGIEQPVVVGHSLGAMIAIELGARHPALARALVADDPGPVHRTELSTSTFDGFAEQMRGPQGEEVRHAWVADLEPTVGDELRRKIVDTMCGVPLPRARRVIEGVTRWNGVAALALCSVPLLILLSTGRGSNDPSRLRAVKSDVHIGMTVGAGHFHQLEVPQQVNAMVERFLQIT